MNGNGSRPGRMRPGFAPAYAPVEPEPLPQGDNGNSRIFAFVDDLFFQAKIQETARKLNVKVEFVKTEKDLLDHMKLNGEEKPSLIIFDMNNANAKPLTLIPKLKTKLKKGTSIIGFLSHVQGDLKQKAHEVGCDMVLPRSAFSQNLAQILRRHGVEPLVVFTPKGQSFRIPRLPADRMVRAQVVDWGYAMPLRFAKDSHDPDQ